MITEDSDMLAYGCPRVLFKMDKGGEGQEICVGDLPQCRAPSFAGFTPDMFLEVWAGQPLLWLHHLHITIVPYALCIIQVPSAQRVEPP